MKRVLVTGGAGFIGSAVCRLLVTARGWRVVNLDKLTYAGNLSSLASIAGSPAYRFVKGDIGDEALVSRLLREEAIDTLIHLAAESHVDRSIAGPAAFFQTNVMGTFALVEACRRYWEELDAGRKAGFRFHHVSTDEVFGELSLDGGDAFREDTPYAPSSPYSASKASSDHIVRAWHRTYGLPVTLSNCSNNYGPFHYPEKLIPLTILNALDGLPLPVYGQGLNVRDWLYVEDHAEALARIVTDGKVGESYNVGGGQEQPNIRVVEQICDILDAVRPRNSGSYRDQIGFVEDRRGHDLRYAIDGGKMRRDLNWQPSVPFAEGLRRTVRWYLENDAWWRPLREKTGA